MIKFITPEENAAAQKVHDDYWAQYKQEWGKATVKVCDLGVGEDQYRSATTTLFKFQAQNSIRRSHELAHFLLSLPDCYVIGDSVGQGSGEGSDSHLWSFEEQSIGGERVISLGFGSGPLTDP